MAASCEGLLRFEHSPPPLKHQFLSWEERCGAVDEGDLGYRLLQQCEGGLYFHQGVLGQWLL